MATQTLRPNGQKASSAPTIVPGGTTYGVMSDNSDTSYVSLAPGTYTWQSYTNPSPAIPAGSIIKRVSSRLRSRKASSAGVAISSGLYRPLGGDDFQITYGNLVVPNSAYFQTATWFSYENAEVNLGSGPDDENRTPTGPQDPALVYPPMTIADVDNLSIRISSFYSGTNWYVAESYLDVVYVPKPVVATVTTVPVSPVTDDDTPTVSWTTTLDTDGGLQTRYEVKIFDAATYGGGGFNASTSTPDATSGVVDSGSTSYTPTTKLGTDTYRAYVRVAQTTGGQEIWSDWSFGAYTFSVNVLTPAVPTVTASPSNAKGRISVGVTANSGATTTTSMEVQSLPANLDPVTPLYEPSAYYALDAANGANDLSGNARHGTAAGGLTVGAATSAPPGLGASSTDFDGSNDCVTTTYTTRRNLAKNPSLETSAAGWGNDLGTIVQSSEQARFGGYSAKAQANGAGAVNGYQSAFTHAAAVAGTTYTLSIYVYSSGATGPGSAFIQFGNAALTTIGQNNGTTTTPAAGAWTRYTVSMVAPANTAWVRGGWSTSSAGTASAYTYFDGLLIEAASSAGTYFDGSGYVNDSGVFVPGTGHTGWVGSVHDSHSDKGCFANGTVRTFAGWMYRDTATTQTFFANSNGAAGYFFTVQLSSADPPSMILYMDGGVNLAAGVATGFTIGGWHHLVVVVDEPGNLATIYVDGVSVSLATPLGTMQWPVPFEGTSNLRWGAYGGGQYFDGRMAQVAVYERGLSAQEVASLYAQGAQGAGGATWSYLRDGFALASPATVLDYEAPNGAPTQYRARATHLFGSGTTSTSAWSSPVSATWTSTDYWLKHPTDPALNTAVTLRSQPERTRAARQGVFRPLGRSYPIVISDTRVEWSGSIVFLCNSDAKRQALVAILEDSVPILLQAPASVQNWDDSWLMFGDLTQARALDAAHGAITFDAVSWVKVERPI